MLADLRGQLGRNGSDLNAYLWFDQKYYLPDDILVKSDRISMAHSLEVRPPFLDHRIVEFANRLPASLKVSGSRQKVVLQQLMMDKLPHSVLHRPKVGFDIPAHDWLRGPLRNLLVETLREGAAEYPEVFRAGCARVPSARSFGKARQYWLSLMGIDDSVVVDEKVEHQAATADHSNATGFGNRSWSLYVILLLVAGSVYLTGIISPPSLQDDVDAVQAQIARNMLTTGDWVTARLDGVAYLEKPPLIYWLMAGSYKVFGVHDWAARLPIALFCIGLCLLTAAFGVWAFGRRAGFYAGLCIGTCVGLYLFTRVLIPDVILAFTITLAMWALLRVTDEAETRPGLWAFLLAASLGIGLLLKSLIGVLFPIAAGGIYLLLTNQLVKKQTWKRLRPFSGLLVILLIAVPWHVLATLRNPPYFSLSMHSGPGEYHGFLWFFFINEQLLRFLNLRYPRDYNTVPRLWFWLFHLAWLFPWSVYLPAVSKLSFKPIDRAGRTRLLALCWVGFILVFFTFSTTQEYYSMPCYPALALLLGSAMAADGVSIRRGTAVLTALASLAAAAAIAILVLVRNVATPGDIFTALTSHPSAYTLSLGHMEDLTLSVVRVPANAAIVGSCRVVDRRDWHLPRAGQAGIRLHHADDAVVLPGRATGADYLRSGFVLEVTGGSDPALARWQADHRSALLRVFVGVLLHQPHRTAVEWPETEPLVRFYAPGAPDPFIDDAQFKELWSTPQRYYLVASDSALATAGAVGGTRQVEPCRRSRRKVRGHEPAAAKPTLPPVAGQHAELNNSSPMPSCGWSSDQPGGQCGAATQILSFVRGTHFAPLLRALAWRNPAIAAQTRYILRGRNLLAAHRTCLPKDRVDLAVREPRSSSSSISGAALHMSPEEDA